MMSKPTCVSPAAIVALLTMIAFFPSTIAHLFAQNDSNEAVLAANQAVTLWWVIFNNPENCITAPNANIKCGPVDVFGADFLASQAAGQPDLDRIAVNTEAGFAMLYATGAVTDEQGNLWLQASIFKSAPEKLDLPLNVDPMAQGVALTNPDGAEVHAIVRTHGDYVDVSQTLSDIDDYCIDPLFNHVGSKSAETGNVCADFMSVAYSAGEEGTKALTYADSGEMVDNGGAQLFRDGDSLILLIESTVY